MRIAFVMIAVLGSACAGTVTGDSDPGGGSDSDLGKIAKQKWETDAYPIFHGTCFTCHGGNGPGPDFVKAADADTMRTTLLNFPTDVVNLSAPDSSRVLTKGAHEGQLALTQPQHDAILGWLTAEKDAQDATMQETVIETARIDVLVCTGGTPGDTSGCSGSAADPLKCCPINSVSLQDESLPGAKITFVAQPYDTSLYISDLYLSASADGVYLEHPLFVSWPTTGNEIPDILDRFFDVKLNLAQSATTAVCPGPSCEHIGPGASVFVNFNSTNKISITFKKLEKFHADTTVPTTTKGCGTKGFASFLANVKPKMTLCATCHGGQNTGATGAMDLTKLASTTDNNACLQAYLHLTLQDPSTSTLLLAPKQGADPTHPAGGKLSAATNPTYDAFAASVTQWITDEQNE